MEKKNFTQDSLDRPLPVWSIVLIPVYIIALLSLFTFLPAGDWQWFEGWVYVLSFALVMGVSYAIINQRNPRVLRNRMKMKKEGLTSATRKSAGSDRFIIPIMALAFFALFLVASFGHRYGWSKLSLWVEMIGLGIHLAGLTLMNMAMLENAFASKILDINKDQQLIDTGLYAHVRHPLYTGGILMVLGIPIALGSLLALLPAAIAALMLVIRIPFEEEMLVKSMPGYMDYQKRVPFRLFPGIF